MPLQLDINEFADLTFEEFQKTHFGLLPGVNGTFRRVHLPSITVSLLACYHLMRLTQNLHYCEMSWYCELQGWRQLAFQL